MNEFENQVLRHTWYLYCLLIWFHTSLEGPKSSISVHHKPNSCSLQDRSVASQVNVGEVPRLTSHQD